MKKGNDAIIINNKTYFEEVERLLAKGKSVKIPVSGNSMRPFLLPGDQVLLRQIPIKRLRIGQIVLGLYQDSFILHRLIKIKNKHLVLAGDGNYKQVEILQKSNYLAVALEAYRKNKKKPLPLNHKTNLRKGVLWYYFRFLRRAYRYTLKRFNL